MLQGTDDDAASRAIYTVSSLRVEFALRDACRRDTLGRLRTGGLVLLRATRLEEGLMILENRPTEESRMNEFPLELPS